MVNIEVTYPKIKEAEEPLLAWQESYNRLFKGFAGFVKIAQSTTKQDDVIERLNTQIKETEELIKRINNAGGINATLSGGAYEGQDLAALNTELRELKEQQKWFGEESKKNNKQSTENVNKQISLIKEMHKQYKELNKEFDNSVAKEKVMTSYAEAFKEIFEDAGLSMSGRIIDDKSLENLKESGNVSEDVIKKIEELSSKGTHIRSFSEDFVSSIKYAEGFIDKARDIGDGKWTYGYGETKGVKEGDTITKEAADIQLRTRLTNDFANSLNKVLDANRDIIVTQEQYNALLDLTYQGGEGAVRNLVSYAKNEEKAMLHIQGIYEKVKNAFGEKEAERFGEAFVNKFKEAENIYDRIALLLQTMNLTVKGGKISSSLYKGMQQRSDERSALFATGKEISKIIQDASIEVSQINIDSAKGVVETLKKLIPYAKSIGEKALEPLLKAIAEFESEVELEPKIVERKSIEDQIEDMFGNYEISLELDKMNIPQDLAKKLFNVDSIDLSELRDKALDIFGFDKGMTDKEIFDSTKFKEMAKNQQEIVKDTLDKVGDLEDKDRKDRAKKYVKYLIQAQGERVKIKMEEIRKLNEIEKLGLNDAQKDLARQAIQKESKQQLDKLEWEDFKNSGMYVQLFEDLDYASTKALERMRERLIELKSNLKDLDADDLRNLYNQVEKLDNELATRNPYKHMIEGAKDYMKAIQESKRLESELNKQSIVTTQMTNREIGLSEEIAKEQYLYEQMSKNKEVSQEDLNNQRTKINFLNIQLAAIKAQLKAQGKLTQELEQQLDGFKNTRKLFEGSISEIGSDISSAASALPQVASDLENVFGAMSEGTKDTIDSISTIAGGVGDAIQGFASQNYIQAIAGVAKAIGGIFAIGDKTKERQIQREIKLVEDLERAYEKLEKQIDKAYEFDTLKGSYDAAQKNIDAQIESYNKMIAAEEDKKKTDHDRIKEWQIAIEDLQEQQREMLESQVEELGGSYDFSSITEEFVNSWLEAFKDTGNGLSGLEDNFEDFWKNIAIKQAVMGGASKIMKPLLDAINKSLEDDFKMDDSEMANIDKLSEKAKENMDLFLQQWYDRWGDFMGEGSKGELSGLQRGIQGVTEETAQIIEAYLNSIRFFVAENNTYLSQIASSFSNTEIENPMVSQLKIIASQTTAINELLNSLTSGGHSMGGRGFRVFIS
jgi:GH24 family phage-related lysozyme (muramidase)